jgi:Txe/YoeB family toxin of Txe-Axe toxin-antitoxin module
MNSSTTEGFRKRFTRLPHATQRLAKKAYRLWRDNPRHPSLHFKKVGNYWSARIDDDHRALGRMKEGTMYWFWIGNHDEYQRVLQLK